MITRLQNKFNEVYDLVQQDSGVKFKKPKLSVISRREFNKRQPMNVGLNGSFNKAEFNYKTNEVIYVNDYIGGIFPKEIVLMHELYHAAQYELKPDLFTPKFPHENFLSLFYGFEGSAEHFSIALALKFPKIKDFAELKIESRENDLYRIKVDTRSRTDSGLARVLSAEAKYLDKQLRNGNKIDSPIFNYQYAIGYLFASRNAHFGFRNLTQHPPRTFRELLVRGAYKL